MEPGPPQISRPAFVINGNYRLIRKLGSGAFGEIFLAKSDKSGEKLAVKLEDSTSPHAQLRHEYKLYSILHGGQGFPKVHWHGLARDFNVLVLDLLGPTLEDLFDFCGRRFSLKTVLMLADQMITRLEYVHSKSYIHRDIKPENFLMGTGRNCNKVHLIDFGLAQKYQDPKTGVHIEFNQNHSHLTGTPRYASLNAHLGMETSRRDDLASLGYVLMYFIRGGNLPWKGLKAATKKQKYDNITELKTATTHAMLCEGYPEEFKEFLEYVDKLKFEDAPDYEYLRGLFLKLFHSRKYELDYQFDWAVYQPALQKAYAAKKSEKEMLLPPPPARRVVRD